MTTPASSTPVWTQRLRVCSYDVDSTRRATSVSVCRYFLDAAWNHAETLGVGFARLAAQGRFWVLSRLRIEFARCPAWGEAFALRTWPRGVKSVFALRDFEMTDDAGSRLAAGTSAWLVVDLVTKRPQRLDRLMPGLSEMNGPSALGRDPEKLPDGEPGDEAFSAPVRYTDLDVNRHVGSSGYVAWLLDAYPPGFHGEHGLRLLEVNYLGETRQGDMLSVRTRQTSTMLYEHSLTQTGGRDICRARLTWEKTPAPER